MQAEITIPSWATQLVSDHTDMDRSPHPVDAAKVSSFKLKFPDDVYFEYAFIDREGRMKADPGNELRAQNPWYPEVSAITGPDYRPSRFAHLADEPVAGSLERHRLESDHLEGVRRVNVYTPQDRSDSELPLLLVQDGTAFLRLAGLPGVLEALIEQGRVRPARLVFVEPADRTSEYGFAEDYRDFTLEELLPFLQRTYPSSEERLLLGASLGGLVSATLALLHPEQFRSLATFSGAFLGTPDDREFYRSQESWILERVRQSGMLPLRWYSEVGTIEWLTGVNRELHETLLEKGYEHEYRERHAGHNWTNWRNGLADALEFLLRR